VNLIAASEMERFVRNGLIGRFDLPAKVLAERRAAARTEAEHFTRLMADEPIGVQIGIVPDTLPHAGFQIFRQPDRHVLALSPFRLGEEPNIRVGVAMITSAPEALALHEKMAKELWSRALRGRHKFPPKSRCARSCRTIGSTANTSISLSRLHRKPSRSSPASFSTCSAPRPMSASCGCGGRKASTGSTGKTNGWNSSTN